MSGVEASTAPMMKQRWSVGADRLARTVGAAIVATVLLLLDLISFSQLIFSGSLASSRAVGLSAMLFGSVAGSLVFAVVRRGTPVTHSFVGAAVIVQAAIAATVAEQLKAAGIVDPDTLVSSALLACGAATVLTGLVFVVLGALRASLLAQLLPYPVLAGFLGGVGLLFVKGGVQIGARLPDLSAAFVAASDFGFLARLAVTLVVGGSAFYLPRRLRHWSVFPGVIVATLLLVHVALWFAGMSTEAAQTAGWLLDPVPDGSLVRWPAIRALGSFDPSLLVPVIPKILTGVVVAVIIQILYVLSVELELQRDLDIDRTFMASGAANLVGSLFGSPAMGVARTPSIMLHNLGGGNWFGWSLTVAVMAGLLVFGATPLALLPRPLAGGALVALGFGLLATLLTTLRTISLWEATIALAVCAATAVFGAAAGFLVGIALAILIFAVQYARIPAIRLALSGAERSSSVIRAPDVARILRTAGTRTLLLNLQGYLFFLNAQAIHRRVSAEAGLRNLVLDFRDCVGLDSSALLVFRKVAQLANQRGFDLLLVQLEETAERQIARSGILALPRVHAFDTLDQALRASEDVLLAEGGISAGSLTADFGEHIGRTLECTLASSDFAAYVSSESFAAGDVMLRQGDVADALYFVQSGILSIELELPNRPNLRLRTTTAGTVIGEVAMMQGVRRTATAIAQTTCRVTKLDRTGLAKMEREQPNLALLVQRFLIVELSAKLTNTTNLLEAETR